MHRPTPGFRPLLLLRLLTVVNDNLLRWLVIGLGKRAAGAAGTALVLTFDDSMELLSESGLPASALIEVGRDHRLADPEPLEALLRAVKGH